jgi:ketosteroid isomerase-like protein
MAEDEDLIRRFFDALNRRDAAEINAMSHPEGEFRTLLASVEGRVYRGREAEAYLTNVEEAWEHLTQSVDKVVRAGPRRYVVAIHVCARSRSGVEADQLIGNVMTVRDGLVEVVESHRSFPDALRAAGVEE